MSDTDGKKPLGLGGGSGRSGQVKQSFSHGRTHNVAVEIKRKRVVVPGKTGAAGGSRSGSPSAVGGDPSKRPAGISDAEMERRMAALHQGGAKRSRADLEISPNLWAGVGLVRGGAGTSLVGSHAEVADLIRQYRDVGFDDFVLSGYPCLEEAYWFGEGVRPWVEALPTEEHSHDRAVS